MYKYLFKAVLLVNGEQFIEEWEYIKYNGMMSAKQYARSLMADNLRGYISVEYKRIK
jgi:hypothetical protein